MPWREQPADLVYAPPQYPSHNYEGRGRCWTIYAGSEQYPVGHLTITPADPASEPEAVGWDAAPPADTPEQAVSDVVFGILRDYAAQGRPLSEAVAEVLTRVQWGWPEDIDLATLAAH